MKISIIVATDGKGGIAKDGNIPWSCLNEQIIFKNRTMGHFVIVGRTTWEGMKTKLPGRKVIVLTTNPRYKSPKPLFGFANNFEQALKMAKQAGENEVFVIGGLIVYNEAIKLAHAMYVTRITGNYSCDTFFPVIDGALWRLQSVESPQPTGCFFYICVYTRKY